MPTSIHSSGRGKAPHGSSTPRRRPRTPNTAVVVSPSGTRTRGTTRSVVNAPAGPVRTSQASQRAFSKTPRVENALKRVLKSYKSAFTMGSHFSPDEAAKLVENVGGTRAEAQALSTKVVGESRGNPKAVGHDPGGTTGLGLWQLTTGVGNDDLINKHGGPDAMLKPKPNASAALELYRSGGLGNWYAPPKPNPKDLKTLRKAKVPVPARPTQGAKAPGIKAAAAKAGVQLSPQQVQKFRAIKHAANSIAGTPYQMGGGHDSVTTPHPSVLDCSGAVSRVLHAAGVLDHPLTSGQMGSVLKPGPGAVTVYYNAGHTFMKIGNRYWGTSVGDSGSGGLGPHPTPSGGYLAEYNVGHVPGLGPKQAAALGVKLTGGGSGSTTFTGGSSSSGGSPVASFASGTSTKGTPGFSSQPILADKRKKKLAKIQASYASSGTTAPSSGTSSLTRKYGQPTV